MNATKSVERKNMNNSVEIPKDGLYIRAKGKNIEGKCSTLENKSGLYFEDTIFELLTHVASLCVGGGRFDSEREIADLKGDVYGTCTISEKKYEEAREDTKKALSNPKDPIHKYRKKKGYADFLSGTDMYNNSRSGDLDFIMAMKMLPGCPFLSKNKVNQIISEVKQQLNTIKV